MPSLFTWVLQEPRRNVTAAGSIFSVMARAKPKISRCLRAPTRCKVSRSRLGPPTRGSASTEDVEWKLIMTEPNALRKQTAARLGGLLKAPAGLKAFIGLDGFVDDILHVVDKRESAEKYTAPADDGPMGSAHRGGRRQEHEHRAGQPADQAGRQRPHHGQRPRQLRPQGDLPGHPRLSQPAPGVRRLRQARRGRIPSPSRATRTRWSSRTARSCSASTSR